MFAIFTDYDNDSRICRIGFQDDVYFTVPDDAVQSWMGIDELREKQDRMRQLAAEWAAGFMTGHNPHG